MVCLVTIEQVSQLTIRLLPSLFSLTPLDLSLTSVSPSHPRRSFSPSFPLLSPPPPPVSVSQFVSRLFSPFRHPFSISLSLTHSLSVSSLSHSPPPPPLAISLPSPHPPRPFCHSPSLDWYLTKCLSHSGESYHSNTCMMSRCLEPRSLWPPET